MSNRVTSPTVTAMAMAARLCRVVPAWDLAMQIVSRLSYRANSGPDLT